MKLRKSTLKRIIREEYTKLQRQGLISESFGPNGTILDLASQPGGVHIDELVEMFGEEIFDTIDRLQEDGLLYMEDDGTVISNRGY
jgi:hypothetical protein